MRPCSMSNRKWTAKSTNSGATFSLFSFRLLSSSAKKMNGTTQSAHGVVQYNSWCSTFKGSMNRLWKKKHVDAVLSKTIFKCSDQKKKKINKSDINRIERKKKNYRMCACTEMLGSCSRFRSWARRGPVSPVWSLRRHWQNDQVCCCSKWWW